MKFKKGDEVVFIKRTNGRDNNMTPNKVYTVLDFESHKEWDDVIDIIDDMGRQIGKFAYKFRYKIALPEDLFTI